MPTRAVGRLWSGVHWPSANTSGRRDPMVGGKKLMHRSPVVDNRSRRRSRSDLLTVGERLHSCNGPRELRRGHHPWRSGRRGPGAFDVDVSRAGLSHVCLSTQEIAAPPVYSPVKEPLRLTCSLTPARLRARIGRHSCEATVTDSTCLRFHRIPPSGERVVPLSREAVATHPVLAAHGYGPRTAPTGLAVGSPTPSESDGAEVNEVEAGEGAGIGAALALATGDLLEGGMTGFVLCEPHRGERSAGDEHRDGH